MPIFRNFSRVFSFRRSFSSSKRDSLGLLTERIEQTFKDERTWAICSMLISIPALFWVYEKHAATKAKKMEKKLLEGISIGEEMHEQELRNSVGNETTDKNDTKSDNESHIKKEVSVEYPQFMTAKYLLVGGGTATAAAMEAIYEQDNNSDIVIVSADEFVPYMRPPLSKELWFSNPETANKFVFSDWEGNMKTIFYRNEDFFESVEIEKHKPGKVRLLKKRIGVNLDLDNRLLTLDNGTVIKYNKILLAPGGKPKVPKVAEDFKDSGLVSTFRNARDFLELKKLVEKGKSIAVYGGGFLGSELAVALNNACSKYGGKVTQIIPEEGNMGLVFPKYLSQWTTKKLEQMGIKIFKKAKVQKIEKQKSGLNITLDNEEALRADHLVLAVGIQPEIELAKSAGLEIDEIRGGIVTNAELEARTNVFAAGDAISFHDVVLGRRRVEHHDHAVLSGITAGSNMIGKKKVYKHQSMYWSDLGPKISFEAVGITDSSLNTVAVWTKPEDSAEQDELDKGLIFYVKEQKIVGILLFNVVNKVPIAKKILLEGRKQNEISSIVSQFDLYSK